MSLVTSRFSAGLIPALSGCIAVPTIIICYIIATTLGHQRYWMPDITHCAMHAPEKFIFRAGMIPTCVLISYLWYMVHGWINSESEVVDPTFMKSRNWQRTAMILGMISGGMLIVSSSVIEDDDSMPWTIHIICASGFFLFSLIAEAIVTLKLIALKQANNAIITNASLHAKITTLVLLVISIVLNIVLGVVKLSNWGNLMEWMCTICVISYNMTYIVDWRNKLFVSNDLTLQSLDLSGSKYQFQY